MLIGVSVPLSSGFSTDSCSERDTWYRIECATQSSQSSPALNSYTRSLHRLCLQQKWLRLGMSNIHYCGREARICDTWLRRRVGVRYRYKHGADQAFSGKSKRRYRARTALFLAGRTHVRARPSSTCRPGPVLLYERCCLSSSDALCICRVLADLTPLRLKLRRAAWRGS
jgi:hypothetical protein